MAKILIFDIETTGFKADFGWLLAFGYKWHNEKKVYVPSIADFPGKNVLDDSNLVKEAHRVMGSADIWVTYNGKLFDVPYMNVKFAEFGLPFLPNIPHVDLYWTVKSNLGALSRKSLANVSYFLRTGSEKSPVEGRTWKAAMAGDRKALKYINQHCKADVLVLEETYERLMPLIRQHPRVAGADKGRCRSCGSDKLQWRGTHFTHLQNPKKRIQCQNCGMWDTRALTTIVKSA